MRFVKFIKVCNSRLVSHNQLYSSYLKYACASYGTVDIPATESRRLARNEQINFMKSQIQNNAKSINWSQFKTNVMAMGSEINDHNFDALVLSLCLHEELKLVGLSYAKYLLKHQPKLNLATGSKILKLYHLCAESIKDYESDVVSLYDSIKSKYECFDATTAENMLLAISRTSKWKDSLDLIKSIKLTCSPSTLAYNAVACSAFLNGDAEIGWKLLNEMKDMERPFLNEFFDGYLKYCSASKEDLEKFQKLEELLVFISNNDLKINRTTAQKIKTYFASTNVEVNDTKISKSGICGHCKGSMSPTTLTTDEFIKLRTTFLEKALKGKDIFLKSNPAELKKFEHFLKDLKGVDIIIDGLNVAYSAGVKKPPKVFAKFLYVVVRHFAEMGKLMVVLGRKHMLSWPEEYMGYVKRNAKLFLTESVSQDDPFLLYAAMYCGQSTCFVSRDLMRSHLFLLDDPDLKTSFRKWQQQHQYKLLFAEERGKIHLENPKLFLTTPQSQGTHWHVPYEEGSSYSLSVSSASTAKWLCISKKKL